MGPTWEVGRADFFGYELPMLVGLILCLFCQKFKNLSLRYLAIYGAGSFVAYSLVKYKTPWCVVSFGWPLLFFSRRTVRVRPDVQRHIQIDETASSAGEARSLQLSPHRTSDPLERVSASVDVGRFRSGRLLRRRKHAGESRWRFSPCAAGQNKRRRIKTEGHLLH